MVLISRKIYDLFVYVYARTIENICMWSEMPVTAKPKPSKSSKNQKNKDIVTMDDVEKEAKSIIDKILGDVSKGSATKQIVLGASSGW